MTDESQEAAADGSVPVQYAILFSPLQRVHRDLLRALWGAGLLALPVGAFAQEVLAMPMNQWRVLFVSMLAVGAVLGWRCLWRNRWNDVVIEGDTIHLDHEHRKQATLVVQDVLLVQGEAGFTRERDVIDWKFVRIATSRGAYRIWLHPEDCQDCYEHLAQLCPQAVGVSYHGDIRIPPGPPGWSATQWLESAAGAVRRAFRRQVGQLAVVAATFAGVFLLLLIAAVNLGNAADASKPALWSIVCFVLAITFALSGFKRWWLGRRVVREIRGEQKTIEFLAQLPNGYPGRLISGSHSVHSYDQRANRRRATTLALLAILSFCLPGVGLFLGCWSYYFGRRTIGGPKYLSIFSLILGLVTTLAEVILLLCVG